MIEYFTPATAHCGCQKIRSVFRVLGMYDFGYSKRQRSVGKEDPFVFCPCIRSLQYGVQYWFPGENCQL